MSRRKRGMSTVEYAVLTCATVSAILMMAIYIRRGIAGSLRNAADAIGEQYEPRNTTGATVTVNSGSGPVTTSTLQADTVNGQTVLVNVSTTTMPEPQVTRTVSHEEVGPMGTDLWK